jgi:hypothetical protein
VTALAPEAKMSAGSVIGLAALHTQKLLAAREHMVRT